MIIYYRYYHTPIGDITIIADENALLKITFGKLDFFSDIYMLDNGDNEVIKQTIRWLDMYFEGKKPDYIPNIRFSSTPFQEKVWNYLLNIPYGSTVTYKDIAKAISPDKKMSSQAVGQAVGKNPIPIIIPCHRVIGQKGYLTGFSGGLDIKKALLAIEGHTIDNEYIVK